MRDVLKKMMDQLPYSFFWLNIVLAAIVTKFANYFCSTIKTIIFFAMMRM